MSFAHLKLTLANENAKIAYGALCANSAFFGKNLWTLAFCWKKLVLNHTIIQHVFGCAACSLIPSKSTLWELSICAQKVVCCKSVSVTVPPVKWTATRDPVFNDSCDHFGTIVIVTRRFCGVFHWSNIKLSIKILISQQDSLKFPGLFWKSSCMGSKWSSKNAFAAWKAFLWWHLVRSQDAKANFRQFPVLILIWIEGNKSKVITLPSVCRQASTVQREYFFWCNK